MNCREALGRAEERLTRADITDAKTDAWLLLQHVTGITRAAYFLSPETELPCETEKRFFRLVEERAAHRPLQHITGTQDFMGFTFRVNEHVLIPRQDTEILVEKAVGILENRFPRTEKKVTGAQPDILSDEKRNYRILDLCTGSGCIAVSLAAWCVRNFWPAEVTGADISAEALLVAKENAEAILEEEPRAKSEENAGTADEHCIRFRQGDLFAAVGSEKFSMILSNPPYIRSSEIEMLMPEVRDFEPRLALDGAEDGLAFYRRIAAESPAHLVQGGVLLLEIGCDEAEAVCGLLADNDFCDILVWKDYAGLDRVVYGKKKTE